MKITKLPTVLDKLAIPMPAMRHRYFTAFSILSDATTSVNFDSEAISGNTVSVEYSISDNTVILSISEEENSPDLINSIIALAHFPATITIFNGTAEKGKNIIGTCFFDLELINHTCERGYDMELGEVVHKMKFKFKNIKAVVCQEV